MSTALLTAKAPGEEPTVRGSGQLTFRVTPPIGTPRKNVNRRPEGALLPNVDELLSITPSPQTRTEESPALNDDPMQWPAPRPFSKLRRIFDLLLEHLGDEVSAANLQAESGSLAVHSAEAREF